MAFVPRLLADPPVTSLEEHLRRGGGRALARVLADGPDAVIDLVTRSGIRGRGGAGFPVGRKWESIRNADSERTYAVCNAAEGEPGTFKDRAILRANPYQVLEGLLVAAHAVRAEEAFLALKASFGVELHLVGAALAEIAAAGWTDTIPIRIATGPDEYLFGEEKALLEVIEGNEPLPRQLPPYLHGLFATAAQLGWQSNEPDPGTEQPGRHSNPTLVNNAESLAQVAWMLAHGVDAFRSVGPPRTPGSVVCTVVGDVVAPRVIEVPMGTPLRSVIDAAGGVGPGRRPKLVLSGVANGVIGDADLDTPLTYEDLDAIGSGLGAAGFIVYDDRRCAVEVASLLSRFLFVESCGQCPPCKLGSEQITTILEHIRDGTGSDADLGDLQRRLRTVTDSNRCYLPVQEQVLVSSFLRSFPEDVAAHLEGTCPLEHGDLIVPKVVELGDGSVTYDETQVRKRPDWTHVEIA